MSPNFLAKLRQGMRKRIKNTIKMTDSSVEPRRSTVMTTDSATQMDDQSLVSLLANKVTQKYAIEVRQKIKQMVKVEGRAKSGLGIQAATDSTEIQLTPMQIKAKVHFDNRKKHSNYQRL